MTIRINVLQKITDMKNDLFGSTYNESLSATDNYDLMVSVGGNGYIRDKIDAGLLETDIKTGFTVSPALQTYIDYFNELLSLESYLDTYFDDDTNNNNYFQDSLMVDENLNPTGRAGYYYRYANAHTDKLSFYGFWKILLKNDVEMDLIDDDFYDYNNYINLKSEYENTFFSDILTLTVDILYTGYGYYEWELTPPDIWNLVHTGGNQSYFNLIKGDISWSEEESFLSSLVIEKEEEVNLISNANLRNAFALMDTVKSVNPNSILYRDLTEYKTLTEFYEEKGINELVELFSVGLITPNDVRL